VWCNFGVWQGGSPPSQGQRIRVVDLPYNGGDGVFTMGSFRDDYRIIGGSYSVGSWKVFFAEYIGTLVDICVGYWPGTTDPMFYSYFMTNETRC
jgi:hypothetical protein